MSDEVTVLLSSEFLDFGSPEERATFGLFAMTANGHLLTAGEDVGTKELRHGPYVSGYPIAEWLVWNWWRLRWETGRPSNEDALFRWESTELGEEALGEIAADAMLGGGDTNSMIRATNFAEIAEQHGFEANPKDTIKLNDMTGVPQPGQVEVWRLGERCARLIRDQEKRDTLPIDDRTLTAFAGATNSAISRQNGNPCRVSFALDGENGGSHVWLRSRRETGRRFDLARLIGDRVLRKRLNGSTEPLLPATRASTYRQKMQRAFAAELLSPFAAVDDMMGGDFSEEKQIEVAEHFNVSPMTIQTLLVNHHRLDRGDAPDIVDRSPTL